MNPNDILTGIRNSSDETKRAIWYLHSRFIEDDGFEKVAAEIMASGIAITKSAKLKTFDNRVFSRANLPENLRQFCGQDGQAYYPAGLTTAILEFIDRECAKAKKQFYLTNIGSQIWETLDWCLEERRPCFIEGETGRGKSTAAQAWYEAHRGEARYVSLPGTRTQRDFFDEIAKAFGLQSLSKFPGEIRWRMKDVIIRSGLILILDEAHHALPERHKAGRPPLIDWINCDLCNAGVPVVLVSTPQFGPMLSEFENRTTWNAGQFRRRFSGRWSCLPKQTSEEDLMELAERALPNVGSKGIDIAVGFAGTMGRDVSGLFDLVRDAERRARKAGHSEVTFQDLRDAYKLDRVPSENAMANAFKRSSEPLPSAVVETHLPEAGEPAAAPLQRRRATESEFTAPDRGTPAPLLVTH